MLDGLDARALRALLEWHLELGADEPLGELPLNRYDQPAARADPVARPVPAAPAPAEAPAEEHVDPVVAAQAAAAGAADLPALQAALAAFPHCELKRGARSTVFADGLAGARVMLIGEAPGRDEDQQGRPFVGRAGQLLDRMLAAAGLARDAEDPARAVYITNILPWRPPQNRDPSAEEAAMLRPFVERHIQLAAPDLLVLMGNAPCATLLGKRGITRLRGNWVRLMDRPCLLTLHPAYLLRNPAAKREAWADLLALAARLDGARLDGARLDGEGDPA